MENLSHYDAAREAEAQEILRAERTSSMLSHLAQAVEDGPGSKESVTYPRDAIEALLHGSQLAAEAALNSRHCVAIYDRLKSQALAEPHA